MSVVSVEKDFDGLSLILLAEFDAPIWRVWDLWADPRQLERWWGHRHIRRPWTSTTSLPTVRSPTR
jgi:uncharacterized protein YndB with AHSA1/START domain